MLARLFMTMTALVFSVAVLAADNQYVLSVKGLACPFCAYGIEKRLNKVDGVTDVEVDVGEGVVRVTLKQGKSFTEEQARQTVSEAGFTLGSFSRADGESRGEDAR